MTYGIANRPANQVKAGLDASRKDRLQVAVCGSFRRDPVGLASSLDRLRKMSCEVLSPTDVNFVEEVDGFVLAEHEVRDEPVAIERRHLDAMQNADFVWLHAPDGYVGTSGAMEIGFAAAQGLRVFCDVELQDITLRGLVTRVPAVESGVGEVMRSRGDAPALGLDGLQRYYERIASQRGWSDEGPAESLKLLSGEVVELEEAMSLLDDLVGKHLGPQSEVASEMADVQLYLVHLANALGIDLSAAVVAKERVNSVRFDVSRDLAA